MAVSIANGMRFNVASDYEAPIAVKGVSNAVNAIMTLETGHDIKQGDILHLNIQWGRMNDLVARAGVVTDTTVELEKVNTSNTHLYPSGGGVGTLRKVSQWTWISQTETIEISGGEQQTIQVQFLEDEYQREIPTVKSPVTATLTINHDEGLDYYSVLKEIDERGQAVAIFVNAIKANESRYYSAVVSFSNNVSSRKNEIEQREIKFSLQSQETLYYKNSPTTSQTTTYHKNKK